MEIYCLFGVDSFQLFFCPSVVILFDFSTGLVSVKFLCFRRGSVGVLFQFMSGGV